MELETFEVSSYTYNSKYPRLSKWITVKHDFRSLDGFFLRGVANHILAHLPDFHSLVSYISPQLSALLLLLHPGISGVLPF